MKTKTKSIVRLVCAVLVASASTPAFAGSHSWKIREVFSSCDGTVQFIELHSCCNGETALNGKWVDSNTNQENFTANLPIATANKHLLLATAGFAALPGAPAPDYIIVDNFFSTSSDLLEYWLYNTGDFALSAGELPTDGVTSLNCTAYNAVGCTTRVTAVNSPTNFAGATVSVDVSCTGDINCDGTTGPSDLALLLGAWGPNPGHPADLNGDGTVGPSDLALLLGAWGAC